AEALDAGETIVLGVVPSLDPERAPTETEVTERVLRWLDRVGLDPATNGGSLVLSATCGLAGASPSWAGQALGLLAASARHLT
ncbi:MAG: methionine synthase, partial [Nocardioides sp.]|nr:methionine synthase [Nocardioides sp.]